MDRLAAKIYITFTIHFATINTGTVTKQVVSGNYLQYTLLLLIPSLLEKLCPSRNTFTIHFATINTSYEQERLNDYSHLQYTLLLLILRLSLYLNQVTYLFTIHFATINTRLFSLLMPVF